jgi:hypothetical protein
LRLIGRALRIRSTFEDMMPAQNLARLAAVDPVAKTLVPLPVKTLFLSLTLLLAGCAAKPPVSPGPAPSDPDVRTPRVEYNSTIGRYTRQRPVTPSAWQKQNELVTPAPKSSE